VPINLHPPLTAFPLALLVLVVALEIYSRCRGADWRKPIEFVLVLMVIAVVAAFFSGYQASDGADRTFLVPDEAISRHHTIGRFLLFLSVPCAALRFVATRARYNARGFDAAYGIVLVICLGLVVYAGYLGGELVFKHGAGVYAAPESLANPVSPDQTPAR